MIVVWTFNNETKSEILCGLVTGVFVVLLLIHYGSAEVFMKL